MIEWLKTSILGIIILGAIGSILAVIILKLCALLVRRFFKPAFHTFIGQVFVLSRAPHHVIEYLRSSSDPRELIVTCTLLVVALNSFVVIMAIGVITVVIGIASSPDRKITGVSALLMLLGSFLTFTTSFISSRVLNYISIIYNIYMGNAEKKALADARDELSQR